MATLAMPIAEAAVGEPEGFATFYQEHFARLVRVVRPFAGEAAEDVAQDAFAVLYQRWAEVSQYDIPSAWLALIAKRIALRRGSRDARRASLEQQLPRPEADRPHDVDISVALAWLPARQASALAIHHLLDRPMSEVAERLGCSESAARVLVHRSRRRIAERLAGYTGRWVSDASWTVDTIVAHLRERGAAAHIGVIVDKHLDGRGGRWELTLDRGAYLLRRDDGLRLDEGRFVLSRRGVVLSPTPAPGRITLDTTLDGNRLSARLLEATSPPTDGVPDEVWMRLFLAATPFTFHGQEALV